jgi:hypothetical protein
MDHSVVQCRLAFPDLTDSKSTGIMAATSTSLGVDGKPVTLVPIARHQSCQSIVQLLTPGCTIVTFRHVVAVICAPSNNSNTSGTNGNKVVNGTSSNVGSPPRGATASLRTGRPHVNVKAKRHHDDSDDDDHKDDRRVNTYFFVLSSGLCIDAAHYGNHSVTSHF